MDVNKAMNYFFGYGEPKCGICGDHEHETHEHDLTLEKVKSKDLKTPRDETHPGHEKEDYLGVPQHWTRAYKHKDDEMLL